MSQGYNVETPQNNMSQGYNVETPQNNMSQGYNVETPQNNMNQGYNVEIPQSSMKQGYNAEIPQNNMNQGYNVETPQSNVNQNYNVGNIQNNVNPSNGSSTSVNNINSGYNVETPQNNMNSNYNVGNFQNNPNTNYNVNNPQGYNMNQNYNINNNPNMNYNTPNNQQYGNTMNYHPNTRSLNFIMFIIAILLKPFQCFKEEEEKLSNIKNSIILTTIVSGAMMLISFIKSLISAVFVKQWDFATYEYKTAIEFSNLKKLDYLELIGKNFLIYMVAILAIAGVYYLASLVVKKQSSFSKLLSIAAASVIPYVVLGMILGPILAKIWGMLAMFCTIIGAVYSIIIFLTLINDNISFDKTDSMIYFNLVCMSILGVAGYYAFSKITFGGLTSSLSNYLDFLN